MHDTNLNIASTPTLGDSLVWHGKFHSLQPYQLSFLPLVILCDPFLHMAHPATDISVRALLVLLQTLTAHFLTLPHK